REVRLLPVFRNIRPYISTEVNTMQCLMSLHQTLQGNKRKVKSPARHREAYRSRLVRLGCEVMEDRVLLSAALPDYHFTAPALVAGTAQHNAPSSADILYAVSGTFTDDSKLTGEFTLDTPQGPVTSVDIWVLQSPVIFGGILKARPAVHFEEDAPPPGQTGFPFSDQFTLYSNSAIPPGSTSYSLWLDIGLKSLPFYP